MEVTVFYKVDSLTGDIKGYVPRKVVNLSEEEIDDY